MKYSALTVGLVLSFLGASQAEIVFNSTNEFSTVQGQDGWYYGYYDGDVAEAYTPLDFEVFPKTNNNSWIVHRGDPSGFWTSLYAVGGHPNGPIANYYQGTEHWTVRRWVSDVSGTLLIEGFIRKSNGTYGDGITAHIFKNEDEIFSNQRPGNDPNGLEFAVEVDIMEGDILDFAISPNSYDMYDSTRFTVSGTLAYELETPVITLKHGLNEKGCVEATSATNTPIWLCVDNPEDHPDLTYTWSTSDGLIATGPEFRFDAALNSNIVVFLTAHLDSTGELESTYQIIRVDDSIAPIITIEKRAKLHHPLKPLDLDISVVDVVDGIITDYTVCMGKTMDVTADAYTGAATAEVQPPHFAAKRYTTDVTVIASDSAGNTAIKTIQVNHKITPPKKQPRPEKKSKSKWSWWRSR